MTTFPGIERVRASAPKPYSIGERVIQSPNLKQKLGGIAQLTTMGMEGVGMAGDAFLS